MTSERPLPQLEFTLDDCQVDHPERLMQELQSFAEKAFPRCIGEAGPHESVLLDLEEVSIVIVSDETIARVHGEFMDDPTPTDVITFHHGEILVSIDTANQVAEEIGHPPTREALLYVIHGILHLNGHHDSEEPERKEMHRVQDAILEAVWPFTSE